MDDTNLAYLCKPPAADQTQANEKRDPPGALTWDSAAERNKLLIPWRLAVSIAFAEQPRCLRVAWMLDGLFNGKTGFCNASDPYLGKLTGLPANKVQEALSKLEKDGAIRRLTTPPSAGINRWRAIYPATEILSVLGGGYTLPVGVTGTPQQPGGQILRRRPRMPKTQLDHARLVAQARQNGTSARDMLGPVPPAESAQADRPGHEPSLVGVTPDPGQERQRVSRQGRHPASVLAERMHRGAAS